MTPEEQEQLKPESKFITGSDLKNQADRTLLYGYTVGRRTWHVYLRDGIIYSYSYGAGIYEEGEFDSDSVTPINIGHNEDYVPNKRLYPECCDFEFCQLLLNNEVDYLPFTTRNSKREEKQYYGRLFIHWKGDVTEVFS